jgi:hypothetical protein
MSPANIEKAVKARSTLIAQVVAIGDNRPYTVGLIVLDQDNATQYAANHGLSADPAGQQVGVEPVDRGAWLRPRARTHSTTLIPVEYDVDCLLSRSWRGLGTRGFQSGGWRPIG